MTRFFFSFNWHDEKRNVLLSMLIGIHLKSTALKEGGKKTPEGNNTIALIAE